MEGLEQALQTTCELPWAWWKYRKRPGGTVGIFKVFSVERMSCMWRNAFELCSSKWKKMNCWMGEFCGIEWCGDDQKERMNNEVSDAVVHLTHVFPPSPSPARASTTSSAETLAFQLLFVSFPFSNHAPYPTFPLVLFQHINRLWASSANEWWPSRRTVQGLRLTTKLGRVSPPMINVEYSS